MPAVCPRFQVARLYTLGTDQIQSYSFRVPRKVQGFYPELYPDTPSDKPALSAEAYFEGKNASPNLVAVESLLAAKGARAAPPAV